MSVGASFFAALTATASAQPDASSVRRRGLAAVSERMLHELVVPDGQCDETPLLKCASPAGQRERAWLLGELEKRDLSTPALEYAVRDELVRAYIERHKGKEVFTSRELTRRSWTWWDWMIPFAIALGFFVVLVVAVERRTTRKVRRGKARRRRGG